MVQLYVPILHPERPIEGAILDRLAHVLGRDVIRRSEVRDRARDLQDAVLKPAHSGLSRRSVEVNKGTLSVRDVPGSDCVFTIDLPRHSITESSTA